MHRAECERLRRLSPCWGWGASGFTGLTTDRWECRQCGRRQKGSQPTAGPEWRLGLCADCAVVAHVENGCPILAAVL